MAALLILLIASVPAAAAPRLSSTQGTFSVEPLDRYEPRTDVAALDMLGWKLRSSPGVSGVIWRVSRGELDNAGSAYSAAEAIRKGHLCADRRPCGTTPLAVKNVAGGQLAFYELNDPSIPGECGLLSGVFALKDQFFRVEALNYARHGRTRNDVFRILETLNVGATRPPPVAPSASARETLFRLGGPSKTAVSTEPEPGPRCEGSIGDIVFSVSPGQKMETSSLSTTSAKPPARAPQPVAPAPVPQPIARVAPDADPISARSPAEAALPPLPKPKAKLAAKQSPGPTPKNSARPTPAQDLGAVHPEFSPEAFPSGGAALGPAEKSREIAPVQLKSVRGTPEHDPIPDLIAALKVPESGRRARAADELGRRGKAAVPALDALILALRDKDPRVRASSALALGNIGPAAKRALSPLKKLLNDRSADVKLSAETSIAKLEAPPILP